MSSFSEKQFNDRMEKCMDKLKENLDLNPVNELFLFIEIETGDDLYGGIICTVKVQDQRFEITSLFSNDDLFCNHRPLQSYIDQNNIQSLQKIIRLLSWKFSSVDAASAKNCDSYNDALYQPNYIFDVNVMDSVAHSFYTS